MNSKRVQPKEYNIERIFKDNQYIVPIYQRNYAWTSVEIEQLLDDINNTSKSADKYYLGSLIVNQRENNVYEVIDGQQRLTTLFLLLCFLKHHSINKNSLSFQRRKKSNKTLQDIFTSFLDMQKIADSDAYCENIINGYSVIKQYFNNNTYHIDEFKKKLASIFIIRIQVPANIDLNQYFERMNTRGEQLELHEILKAKVISAIKEDNGITEEDRKIQNIVATIWDGCVQMNKYVQMCFEPEVREKLFGKNWDTLTCKNFEELHEKFTEASSSISEKFTLVERLEKIKNAAYHKKYINNQNNENIDKNERFESIINFSNFLLHVNAVMHHSQQDVKTVLDDNQLITSLEDAYSSKEKALEFIFNLLKYRYLFDRYIIKREYIGEYQIEGKWALQRLEKRGNSAFYKATISQSNSEESKQNQQLCMLQACLRITYTSPITMHWITKGLIEVGRREKEANIISLLEGYCCDKLIESKFQERKGFAIERIVFSYLDYILWRDNQENFKEFQFHFKTSIEHFFPQNPISTENKINNIDDFGNLALLTVSANSKFSNMMPIHKVEQYPEMIAQSPKLMRMKDILDKNNREWSDVYVNKHRNEMWKILEKEMKKYKVKTTQF